MADVVFSFGQNFKILRHIQGYFFNMYYVTSRDTFSTCITSHPGILFQHVLRHIQGYFFNMYYREYLSSLQYSKYFT